MVPAPAQAPLNRPLKNKPLGKTTPPSINHSNYKVEKEKEEKKRRKKKEGAGVVTDRKKIGRQADTRRRKT